MKDEPMRQGRVVRRSGVPVAAVVAALAAIAIHAAAPAPARAQAVREAQATEHTVTVSATGKVTREPDRAVLLLAVESFAATAQEAAAENARKMDALLAALRRSGIDEGRIRTVSYQLNPEYDYRPDRPRVPGEPNIVGYRAVNMVQVTIDDVPRVGPIIDAAIGAGANRVTGLSFQLRDPDAARHDAIRQAISKARAEAEAIASALGRQLGPALQVTTTGAYVPPPQPFAMRADAAVAAAPTPIEPGTLDIQATVLVVYRLEPAS